MEFEPEHAHHLLEICREYNGSLFPKYFVDKWKVKTKKMEAKVQYLSFRRAHPAPGRPVPVHTLPCTEKYALISAENGHTGYVLENDGNVFYIVTKLYYDETTPISITNPSVNIQSDTPVKLHEEKRHTHPKIHPSVIHNKGITIKDELPDDQLRLRTSKKRNDSRNLEPDETVEPTKDE